MLRRLSVCGYVRSFKSASGKQVGIMRRFPAFTEGIFMFPFSHVLQGGGYSALVTAAGFGEVGHEPNYLPILRTLFVRAVCDILIALSRTPAATRYDE